MHASPAPDDNVAALRSIWGPLERGESKDFQPFFDRFAEDVVFKTAVGEVRGKDTVMRYFAGTAGMLEFDPFVEPLEYFGNGDRVVQLGYEKFTVKETGAEHEGEWAFVYDMRDGLISRIVNIQDMSGVGEYAAAAIAQANAG